MSADAHLPHVESRVALPRPGMWRTFDVTSGLMAGARALAQDRDGYLWIATAAGLVRFDGTRFITFTMHDGLPGNNISHLLFDGEGRLWLGILEGGIACLKDGVVTASYGQDHGLIDNNVTCLAFDASRRLWIGTHAGISRFDGSQFQNIACDNGLVHPHVLSLCPDRAGFVWVGCMGGVSRFESDSLMARPTTHDIPHVPVWHITLDYKDRVWLATDGRGALCLDGDRISSITTEQGLPSNRLRCVFSDRRACLWFATWGNGVARYDGASIVSYSVSDGLLDNRASCFFEDYEEQIWVAHILSGMSCFDPHRITLLTDTPVLETIIRDRKERLWFGNDETLCCLHNDLIRSRSFPSRINALLEDSQGRFWVGTRVDGIFLFPSSDDVWGVPLRHFKAPHGIGNDSIVSLYEAPDGSIWAGTRDPGSLLCLNGDVFEAIETPHNVIFRMLEDAQKRFWFGGYDARGLGCLEHGAMRTYRSDDGLPNDSVQSLLEDSEHRLWIGTQGGLSVYDGQRFRNYGPREGLSSLFHQCSARDTLGLSWFGTLRGGIYITDGKHFQWLTTDDGLPSNSIAGLIPLEDGAMAIGTYRGIAIYRPGPQLRPQVVIRADTDANEAMHPPPKTLSLTLTQAHEVKVRFAALSLSTRHMLYSYRLLGYDATWRDTWETEVRFEDLPVGTYAFEALAINRDLLESEAPATLSIVIMPDPNEQLRTEYEARLGEMARRLEIQRRSNRQSRVLVDLTRSQVLEESDLAATFREVVELIAQTLECDRAGAWLLAEDGSRLECAALFDRRLRRYSEGLVLSRSDYPRYFDRLAEDRTVTSQDAAADAMVGEMLAAYIQPHGIGALVHAAVRVHGEMIGLISAEHCGGPRPWALDEQYFVGSIADFVSLATEMFERRRAEEALRASEQRYRAFITRTTEGIWRCELDRPLPLDLDEEQQIRHLYRHCYVAECNDAFARMYGFERAFEMVGLRLRSGSFGWWLHDPERLRMLVQSGFRQSDVEIQDTDRHGCRRFFLNNVVGITKEGLLTQMWGAQRDITGLKVAEEERKALEDQLRQSHKMEAIGRLAGGVAHDFNNLLTAILGCTDLLLADISLTETTHAYLEEIKAASMRAAALTKQLLAFSRRQVLQPRIFDLNDVVRNMDRMLRRIIGENIELVVTTDDRLCPVKADPNQIDQVILNLVVNARDAMPQGGQLGIRTRTVVVPGGLPSPPADLEPGEYALLSVSDTGSGMDEVAKAHVFEPFFTTKGEEHGTGLGLSTVYGIVKQSGGAIVFESELHQGTSFHVFLPCSKDLPQSFEGESASPVKEQGFETVLVVEDEEIVRHLVRRILKLNGYRIIDTSDPEEAERLCQEHPGPIHLLLTDVMMPKRSGYQLARRLRRLRPNMRVLYMSGYTDEALAAELPHDENIPFIQKPFGIRALAAKIRAVLDASPDTPPPQSD